MATKLYIGNLSYETNEDGLKELFGQAGAVASASVILDRMTGRSRGFGFVEMADDAGAAKAVETFNGYELEGRKLVVNEARPMSDRPRTGGGAGGRGGFRGGSGGNRGGGWWRQLLIFIPLETTSALRGPNGPERTVSNGTRSQKSPQGDF